MPDKNPVAAAPQPAKGVSFGERMRRERELRGVKLEEIAEGSSCTVRTVRNRLRAAAALLGRELKRRGIVTREGEVTS